ncbi:hypothetical protein R5R35_008582 [Gryllus longicercus]|uniref:DNA-3-methyladenine glycosylase n=1 Tax=Gryllus longicercus TaxID=2509291 RepID=A0AAN9V7M5_9ORTH
MCGMQRKLNVISYLPAKRLCQNHESALFGKECNANNVQEGTKGDQLKNDETSNAVVVPECIDGTSLNSHDGNITDECASETSGDSRLTYSFYNVPCEELAQKLLGKVLVRSLENGIVLKGRIVETECYLGGNDKASHSFNGKVTPRNKPMFMKPGTTYVYFTYGMYFCFNISSLGDGAAVLVRAVDPLQGHDFMNTQRINQRMRSKKNLLQADSKKCNVPTIKPHELCNGPGKLCISLCIDEKSCNMQDLSSWGGMWIESDSEGEQICSGGWVTSTRIGIDSAGPEWALKPLRFYIFGNNSVSKRDRKREQERLMLLK